MLGVSSNASYHAYTELCFVAQILIREADGSVVPQTAGSEPGRPLAGACPFRTPERERRSGAFELQVDAPLRSTVARRS